MPRTRNWRNLRKCHQGINEFLAKPFVGTDRSVIADPVDVDDCVHSTPFPLRRGELTGSQIGESRGEEEGPRLGLELPGKGDGAVANHQR